MLDQTIYFLDDHTPELAVRQIFGRQRSPAKLCRLFAGLGLLTLDCVVHLGEDPATVRKTFTRIIDGDNQLGSDLDEQDCNWFTISAIWQSCKRLVYAAAASGSLAQFLKTLRSLRRQVSLCRSSRRPSVFEAQETEEYRSSS